MNAELTMARTRDGMRMAQVSAETINPAHPGSRFSGGNLETLSDKRVARCSMRCMRFVKNTIPPI